MTNTKLTINGLRKAVETRNAASLKSYYADDAVLTIIDFLDDVYSRDMTHTVEMGLIEGNSLAFVQGCKYGDGTRVIASSTAELGPKGIVRQTTVQAWDN